MGLKWMLRWRPAAGSVAGPGDEEALSRLLDAFDAKVVSRERRFEVNVHLMKQMQAAQAVDQSSVPAMKDVWLVRSSDAMETFYLVHRREHRILEADNGITKVLEGKMDYRTKIVIKLEGRRYNKGDFQIRLATATQTITGISGQQVFLGHVLEIEYTPLSNLVIAGPLMQEFVSMLSDHIPRATPQPTSPLLGSLEPIHPSFDKYLGLPHSFGNMHSAVLYAEVAVTFVQHKTQAV